MTSNVDNKEEGENRGTGAASTLQTFLDRERELIHEASLTLPHSFAACTYSLGYIRQPVYLCKTCAVPRGLCSACSVACHTDHEQIELFPKRAFRCDCPTASPSHSCTLIKSDGVREVNMANVYGQNFEDGGKFCRCKREYDAQTERETMVQCLVCEDWYHESCLNLRERPPPVDSNAPSIPSESVAEPGHLDVDSDAETESVSDPTLPPAILPGSEYESFVCRDCVLTVPLLVKYAGTPGVMMVTRSSRSSDWEVIGRASGSEDPDVVGEANTKGIGDKRKRHESQTEADDNYLSPEKRPRLEGMSTSGQTCLAPPPSERAQQVLGSLKTMASQMNDSNSTPRKQDYGAGDIFLSDGFRTRWCQCSSCSTDLTRHPYLLTEEETYEPPDDPDSTLSLEELGMRALNNVPRDRAIDGIVAYNKLRDELMGYLRPFANEGKVVSEEDIKGFFALKEQEKALARAST